MKTPALLVGAICGSALGNIVGFGPLSGGAVRLRVYGSIGVEGRQVARLMAWITASFGAGLLLFAAANVTLSAEAVAKFFALPTSVLRLAGATILALGAAGTVFCRPDRPALRVGRLCMAWPSRRIILEQVALVAVDLLTAGAALWVLLPTGSAGFLPFEAVFAIATALGVLSHVPGGLGVFEAVVIFTVGKNVSPSDVMAALVGYRLIYFFLPLLLSGALLAGFELRNVPAQMSSPTMRRVREGAGQLAPLVLGVITFSIGSMLVLSGATPAFQHRLALLAMTVPLWAVESSHFLASLLGVVLLFVARGLTARLDGAWWMALTIACFSLILSLGKGLAFIEAGILLCFILLLLATRRRFDRPAWMLCETFTAGCLLPSPR